jgi:predicted ATPase
LFRSDAVSEARRSAPFNLAYALYQHWLGDWAMDGERRADAMLQEADEILAISNEHGFALWLAFGNIQRGWCLVMLDQSAGIELLLMGLAGCQAAGCGIVVPFYLCLLAEAYGRVGRFQEARERLADTDKMIERTQEAWPAAEVHRLMGRVLLETSARAAAEDSFRRALDIARRQSAKFWELRAAIDLARFWCEQSKRSEARELLTPVYGWFTEGFDTGVLKEAKSLLAEL